MLVEVRVPVLAESVAEATLMDWHKQPGDAVRFGDALVDVETDKVTLEVVAPEDGVLSSILKNSGEDVESNELIAEVDTSEQASFTVTEVAPEAGAAAEPIPEPATEPVAEPEPVPKMESAPEPEHASQQQSLLEEPDQPDIKLVETQSTEPLEISPPTEEIQPETKLSPAVRNLLAEHNLDAAEIPTSGDRLTKENVLNYLAGEEDKVQEAEDMEENDPADVTRVAAEPATVAVTASPSGEGERRASPPNVKTAAPIAPESAEKRVAMSRLRKRAAERLLVAQRENAILTTFNEVNMQPVQELRNRYKDSFEKTHGVKLGFMSFFTKAAVEALKKIPIINASVDGTDIIYHDYFDIGIAVSSSRGLVVPIIRNADTLSFAAIEKTIGDYGQKARDAKLTLEELIGGTFTITNGGVFGSLLSTPIINPPQSAILGMHKIEQRPVAENGEVVIRPMMYLALSYDHRIIDGREAVSFLVTVKDLLEDPSRLLLQV